MEKFDGQYLRIPDLTEEGSLRVPSTLGSLLLAGPVELLDRQRLRELLTDVSALGGMPAVPVHPVQHAHCRYGCLAVSELQAGLLAGGAHDAPQVPTVAGVRAAYPMRARALELSSGAKGWISVVRHRKDPCAHRLFILVGEITDDALTFLTEGFTLLDGVRPETALGERVVSKEERSAMMGVGIPEKLDLDALESRLVEIDGERAWHFDGGASEISAENGSLRVDATQSLPWARMARAWPLGQGQRWGVHVEGETALLEVEGKAVGQDASEEELWLPEVDEDVEVQLAVVGGDVLVAKTRREAETVLAQDAYAPRMGQMHAVHKDSDWVRLTGVIRSVRLVGNRFTGVCYWSGMVGLDQGEVPFCIPTERSAGGYHDLVRPGEVLMGRFLLLVKVVPSWLPA